MSSPLLRTGVVGRSGVRIAEAPLCTSGGLRICDQGLRVASGDNSHELEPRTAPAHARPVAAACAHGQTRIAGIGGELSEANRAERLRISPLTRLAKAPFRRGAFAADLKLAG